VGRATALARTDATPLCGGSNCARAAVAAAAAIFMNARV